MLLIPLLYNKLLINCLLSQFESIQIQRVVGTSDKIDKIIGKHTLIEKIFTSAEDIKEERKNESNEKFNF